MSVLCEQLRTAAPLGEGGNREMKGRVMVVPVGGAGGQKSVKAVTFWLVLTGHFHARTEGQTQPVNQAWSLGYQYDTCVH